MPSEPIYLRWENTAPPHCKFYELEVELSLFFPKKLIRRWGRIGTVHPQSLQLLVDDPDELERQVNRVSRRRDQHGYRQVSALYTPALAGIAA